MPRSTLESSAYRNSTSPHYSAWSIIMWTTMSPLMRVTASSIETCLSTMCMLLPHWQTYRLLLWVPLICGHPEGLITLLTLVNSSLLAKDHTTNGRGGVFFLVLARKPNQKAILFSRVKDFTTLLEDSEDLGELPEFSSYTSLAHRIMKRLGYDFESKLGLNFRQGRRTVPLPRSQKKACWLLPLDYERTWIRHASSIRIWT